MSDSLSYGADGRKFGFYDAVRFGTAHGPALLPCFILFLNGLTNNDGRQKLHADRINEICATSWWMVRLVVKYRLPFTAGPVRRLGYSHRGRCSDQSMAISVRAMDVKCLTNGRYLVFVLLMKVTLALECYMCENEESNFMCINENLKECEPSMDTCQTIVAYSDVGEKLSITKTCTKRQACSAQVNATLESVPCDPSSGKSWICTYCCYESACNLSEAASKEPTWLSGILPAINVAYGSIALLSLR